MHLRLLQRDFVNVVRATIVVKSVPLKKRIFLHALFVEQICHKPFLINEDTNISI